MGSTPLSPKAVLHGSSRSKQRLRDEKKQSALGKILDVQHFLWREYKIKEQGDQEAKTKGLCLSGAVSECSLTPGRCMLNF